MKRVNFEGIRHPVVPTPEELNADSPPLHKRLVLQRSAMWDGLL